MTNPALTQARQKSLGSAVRKRTRSTTEGRGISWSGARIPSLILVVATLALYAQVLNHDFIRMDDEGYVTQNLHVRAGLTWSTIRWAMTSIEQANWHPLTWLSHALDCQLFGLRAGAHHFTSALLHVVNVVLLFLLLRRATGATWRSFVVAAFFAWHPFNAESVAWVAERKNVLSTLFFLLTLGAYGGYARKPNWSRYLAVVALFVLALAAKPMVVTLPFVLLLLDFWPLQRIQAWLPPSDAMAVPQRPFWHVVLEKLPLLALSAASSLITMVAQRGTIATTENLPLTLRLINAFYSYFMYVWKMLWPFRFAAYYPHPFISTTNRGPEIGSYVLAAVGGAMLVAVGIVAWRERVNRPYVIIGWLWYLGTLVPVLGIVQVGMQAMADRYAYLPLIGLFVIVVWGTADLARSRKIAPAAVGAVAAVVLATLWALTFIQVGYWRSGYDLWEHTLLVTEDNFVAEDNMADALMTLGRPESIQYFADAARIAPHDGVSHGALAAYLQDQGRFQDAIEQYDVVVQNPPSRRFLAFAHANLCIIYFELKDSAKAQSEFQSALAADRDAVEEMIGTLGKAASEHPVDEVDLRLGLLLEESGRTAEARAACAQALKLNPNRGEALDCLNRLDAANK